MGLAEDVTSVAELEEQAAKLVARVAEERRTVVITEGGSAKAVLMDATSYDQWRNSVALLKMVAQGEADLAAGRVVSQEDAFARADRAIDRLANTP